MMEDRYSPEHPKESRKAPEARYAYYRRCQVFRRNGEQCKAPAEKGSPICHAHAGQLAMAVRRERERRAVLAEAVAEMRRRGRPDCKMADLLTDFKGIQVTLAVMSRAVIRGTIDCKTAGQMVVHLQTLSKLLWQVHRRTKSSTEAQRHREKPGLPQICADERRLDSRAEERPKTSPLINTNDTDLKKLPKAKTLPRIVNDDAELKKIPKPKSLPRIDADDADRKKPRLEDWGATSSTTRAPEFSTANVLQFNGMAFGNGSRAHGPPEWKAA